MALPLFLSNLIGGAVGSMIFLPLAVMLCAFILEDATTVVVGLLAADHIISVPIALISLYIGIILGDIVLYSLGSFARSHPRLGRYVDHEFTAPFRCWIENRYSLTILSGHFVPGLRLTTYIASGFFQCRLSTFIGMAVIGGLLWSTALFSVSYWFANFTAEWFGAARWAFAFVFLIILFFIGKHNLSAYRTKKDGDQ